MQRVTGVGGIFVKARDPQELARWYSAHLGVDPPPESYGQSSWWQEAGPTVLAAMGDDSGHFGGAEHSWALNFRVADLDAMVEQLRAGGVVVEVDPQEYPNGRFASLQDPEGNQVQLWQPEGADRRGPA
ncbi:VOC family protein [Kineococcus indalonis]|uniref:VOC family protein n=1 Tax=Kineococcus indalonis TaxID=2696566 RepID=UPI0014127E99|nr:VOC family protein [Kineococcus indalonis]NAZ84531.1 VOC family protein [Kineococcus indalonis]